MPIGVEGGGVFETSYDAVASEILDKPNPLNRVTIGTKDTPTEEPAKRGVWNTLTGADGGERYQLWPEKVAREMLTDVARAFTLPGRGYRGEVADEDITEEAFNFATTFMGGGLATSPMRESGVGIFGGKLGTMNDAWKYNNTRVAEDALKSGFSPKEVYDKTGMFLGPDFKLRYEIPDTGAKLKLEAFTETPNSIDRARRYEATTGIDRQWVFPDGPPAKMYDNPYSFKKDTTVGDILDHPELYKHYPDIAKIKLEKPDPTVDYRGRYSPANDTILLEGHTEGEMLSTLLHEIQHAVQKREGFVRGGNPTEWMENAAKTKRMQEVAISMDSKLRSAYDEVYQEMGKEKIPKGLGHYASLRFMFNKEAEGAKLVKYERDAIEALERDAPKFVEGMRTMMEGNKRIRADEDEAFRNYQSMFGETESRIVQERMYYTKKELKDHPYEGGEFKNTYPDGVIKDKHLVEQGQAVDKDKGVTTLPE